MADKSTDKIKKSNNYLSCYYFYCELANNALKTGKKNDAVAHYETAIEYIDKYLAVAEEDSVTRRMRERRNEILALIANPTNQGSSSLKNKSSKESIESWFSTEIPKYKLSDVKGLKNVIDQIESEILIPLRHPNIYYQYVNDVSSRILLYGPPGTGKTFVVKCLAGELGCKIALAPAKKILDKYVGEAESRIGEIFAEADQYDRSLIFFDEIDVLASDRDSDDSRNTKGILTTLLTEMDGFTSKNERDKLKIVIAATNKPWALDPAIRRGGRFDTPIYVSLPDYEARFFMIENTFRLNNPWKKGCYPPIDGEPNLLFDKMAQRLDAYYGGGDIVAICKRILKNASQKAERLLEKDPNAPLYQITYADCCEVIDATPCTINQAMLDEFEKFSKGLK